MWGRKCIGMALLSPWLFPGRIQRKVNMIRMMAPMDRQESIKVLVTS